MTYKPAQNMTKKQIEKELNRQAVVFEEQCNQGLTGDGRQKFGEYARYAIALKEKSGELRHHTVVRYNELLARINEGIGHIKLTDIRPQHLNKLYEELSQEGLRKNSSKAVLIDRDKLHEYISLRGYTNRETFIKEVANLSYSTYKKAIISQYAGLSSLLRLWSFCDNTKMNIICL